MTALEEIRQEIRDAIANEFANHGITLSEAAIDALAEAWILKPSMARTLEREFIAKFGQK